MSTPVLFRPEAEADVEEAHLWYFERGHDLGADFVRALADAVDSIQHNPEAHPVVHRDVRRVLLRRFPYGLFYLYQGDQIARGRGLALSTSIVALPYYNDTLPVRANHARTVIREVLDDQEQDA